MSPPSSQSTAAHLVAQDGVSVRHEELDVEKEEREERGGPKEK